MNTVSELHQQISSSVVVLEIRPDYEDPLSPTLGFVRHRVSSWDDVEEKIEELRQVGYVVMALEVERS